MRMKEKGLWCQILRFSRANLLGNTMLEPIPQSAPCNWALALLRIRPRDPLGKQPNEHDQLPSRTSGQIHNWPIGLMISELNHGVKTLFWQSGQEVRSTTGQMSKRVMVADANYLVDYSELTWLESLCSFAALTRWARMYLLICPAVSVRVLS